MMAAAITAPAPIDWDDWDSSTIDICAGRERLGSIAPGEGKHWFARTASDVDLGEFESRELARAAIIASHREASR
jgi:hypothetical protein